MTKQQSLIILAVIVLVGGFVTYQYLEPQQAPAPVPAEVPEDGHVITLTEEGFKPAELTIRVGEAVTFRNETDNLYWPASNLHPSHLIYSEFDPKEPVQPDASWSFTFTKVGGWQFHDHLAPYFTGVITVTE